MRVIKTKLAHVDIEHRRQDPGSRLSWSIVDVRISTDETVAGSDKFRRSIEERKTRMTRTYVYCLAAKLLDLHTI